MKLVSILIPTYNQPEFFRQALQSALNQDYPNIEIIVSDDSTDDRVEKVCSEFLSKPQRFPIQYLKHQSTRAKLFLGSENLIYLLNQAHGDYVNFLLHDDLFMPNKISKMVTCFETLKDKVAFVWSSRYIVDENANVLGNLGMEIDQNRDFKIFSCDEVGHLILLSGINFIGEFTTVLMRRDFLYNLERNRYEVGRYFDQFYPFHLDLPTFLELCRMKDLFCVCFSKPLSAFRKHSEQNSSDASVMLNIFLEYMAMIANSYVNDVFVHDVDSLQNACESWLNQINLQLKKICDSVYDSTRFSEMDLLINCIESLNNKDYDRFLKLITSRKRVIVP